jgi:hypothetical protein
MSGYGLERRGYSERELYEKDLRVVTGETMFYLERACDNESARRRQAEARWHRAVATVGRLQREREEGRIVAWLFALGAFGEGLALAAAIAFR